MDAVVEIRNLTRKYGGFVALDNLFLTLQRGSILGFIGPNGAGKTTMIRILVGQSRPTSGSAMIAGADCVRDSRKTKQLFQKRIISAIGRLILPSSDECI